MWEGFAARCNSKPNKTLRNQKASDGKLQLCCVTVTVTCCSCLTEIQKVRGGLKVGEGVALNKKNVKMVKRNFAISLCTWKTVINLMKECCCTAHLPDT